MGHPGVEGWNESTLFRTGRQQLKSLHQQAFFVFVAGVPGFEPGMPESESGALPLGDTPKCGGYDGIRTCDPSIMSAVL